MCADGPHYKVNSGFSEIDFDAVGNVVNIGDRVAHVSRRGSSIYYAKRTVTGFITDIEGRLSLILDHRERYPVKPCNVVVTV